MKAKIPNPRSSLLPGEYVKLRITVGETKNAIVVPEQSVIQTQAGPVVYIVDQANQVAIQRVQALDQPYEGQRVITGGLEPGTKVIVEGLQVVRPKMQVKTEEYQPPRPIAKKATAESPPVNPPTLDTAPNQEKSPESK